MKALTWLGLLVANIGFGRACITAHIYQQSCAVDVSGTQLTAQVWDNGVEVCSGGDLIAGASNEDTFHIHGCQDGYAFEITDLGREATIHSPNEYTYTGRSGTGKSIPTNVLQLALKSSRSGEASMSPVGQIITVTVRGTSRTASVTTEVPARKAYGEVVS